MLRDDVGGVAGLDAAPGDREARAGVDAAGEDGGDVGGDPGGGGDEVGGEVRAGGVAAGAVEGDLEAVAGGGDGAHPEADLPGVDPGVAVDGDDPADALQDPGLDRVGGTAGQDLLGGLEDQPHGVRQEALAVELGEDQSGAEDGGGVDIVSAGVGAVGHGGAVGDGLDVGDGQRVEVAADRQHGQALGPGADVTDEPGAGRQDLRREAGRLQAGLERGGRTELLVPELGVHVQVPAEGDEFGAQGFGQRSGQGDGAWLTGLQLVHPLKGRPVERSTAR